VLRLLLVSRALDLVRGLTRIEESPADGEAQSAYDPRSCARYGHVRPAGEFSYARCAEVGAEEAGPGAEEAGGRSPAHMDPPVSSLKLVADSIQRLRKARPDNGARVSRSLD
jgi:hypothetical protein